MKILKKIMAFFTKKSNSVEDECYLKLTSDEQYGIRIDFRFDEITAPNMANILFQLDTGSLTIAIMEMIQRECEIHNKVLAYETFAASLSVLTITQTDFTDTDIAEPIIKPSNVFRYTGEQPKFD